MLSMVVIVVWAIFINPKPPPAPPGEGPQAGSTVAAADTTTPEKPPAGPPPETPTDLGRGPLPGDTAGRARPALAPAVPEETITVKTEVFEVDLSSLGAAPRNWRLMNYPMEKCFKYRVDIAMPPFKKDPACDTGPVDMIDPDFAPPNYPFVAELKVDGKNNKIPVNAQWEPVSGDLDLKEGDSAGEAVFQAALPDGRSVKKIYRFTPGGYDVDLSYVVEGEPPKSASLDMALFYQYEPMGKSGVPRWNYNGAEAHDGRALRKLDSKDVIKEKFLALEGMDWVGFTDDYFLTAVLSEEGGPLDFVVKYLGTEAESKDKRAPKDLVGWVRLHGSEEELEKGIAAHVTLYMGPKDKRLLVPVRGTLRYSIDYGRLKILVLPLIEALVWIDKVVGNYGVSIIILTVILRMGMFPLTRTSQKSMKQMQKLQPEIQKIREKYPDDKAKQQEEMQGLWRKHGINPFMGCLPILLQFPVFFAFYKALLISIELRQAPFFGWIIDLGARDPLYIWPVLMGATQLVTQKMTPTQMDPAQAKIFLAMPIVFMYILRDFPSGLLIYWTMTNLVGIAQQIYVNRQPD